MPACWQTGNSPGMILILESNFMARFITFNFFTFFTNFFRLLRLSFLLHAHLNSRLGVIYFDFNYFADRYFPFSEFLRKTRLQVLCLFLFGYWQLSVYRNLKAQSILCCIYLK